MKMTKQMTKALEKLNTAITNLPEFADVMKLVPSNVAITNCELMECETKRTWGKGNNTVTYNGLVLHDGDGKQHNYLIHCVGQKLFCTNGTLEEIAQLILTALEKAPKKRDKLQHSISVSNYLRDKLNYPHMHQSVVGEFTLKRFETLL